MDKLSAAVDAELVIEFCSITGADSDTAIALLEHNRNNLQLALDSFFRQPCDAGKANMTVTVVVCSSRAAGRDLWWSLHLQLNIHGHNMQRQVLLVCYGDVTQQ